MKKVLIALIMLIIVAFSASAVSITDYFIPGKDTTVTASRIINFKVAINDEQSVCLLGVGLTNGTYLGNYTMNKTGKAYNYTVDVGVDTTVGTYNNYTIFCGNSTTKTKIETVNFAVAVARPTAVSPIEGQIYATQTPAGISCTVPVAIATTNAQYACWYDIKLSNGTDKGWTKMSSTANITWINSSAINFGTDSGAGAYHNITYRCNDTRGQSSAAVINFIVDTTAPTFSWGNFSMNGGVVRIQASVTDNTAATCSAVLFDATGAQKTTTAGTASGTPNTASCNFTITPSEIGQDGAFNLEGRITDAAANTATRANKTGIVKGLYAGWNLVSYSDVTTNLSNICNMLSSCTYTSVFDNSAKTFTTYSSATPSVNGGTSVSPGAPVYIYVSSTEYIVMNDRYPNTAATENVSLVTGWNLYGVLNNVSLNKTFQTKSTGNITYTSKLDASTGLFYTCSKASKICAGTSSLATAIVLPKGTAIWVLSDNSFSVNRSEVK